MKMSKVFLSAMLSISLLGLAACGNETNNSNGNTGNSNVQDSSASGESYKIILTHALAEDTSNQAGALAFKEYAESHSEGKLIVEVYPNSQMGSDREQLEGVQEGSITAALTGSAVQVNFVSSATIFDMPFAFSDIDSARKTFTDDKLLEAMSKEYEQKGFKLLGAAIIAFRNLTSNIPVTSPDDLQGFKIRTMESKYHMEAWKALGANPTPMPVNELYTALQQKVVDGQENPLEVINAQKFYEQQKYITKTQHVLHPLVWVMNKEFYDGLPVELQTVVDEAFQAGLAASLEYQDENEAKLEQNLKDNGNEVVELTAEQITLFAEKTKPIWEMIKGEISPEVYDAYVEALK